MDLDLHDLRKRHPRLPASTVVEYIQRAGLGLQRHRHRPGAEIALRIEEASAVGTISWPLAELSALDQLDAHRITEDAAEAIALTLVHEAQQWQVVRRLQRFESADWLLERTRNAQRQLSALEISGIDDGPTAGRLHEKLVQVARCVGVDHRSAAVVCLSEPEAVIAGNREGRDER